MLFVLYGCIFSLQLIHMKTSLSLVFLLSAKLIFSQTITTKFEQSQGTQSPTYYEIIDWWKKLDQQSPYVKMITMGMTDAGFPLHLVVISADKDFNFESMGIGGLDEQFKKMFRTAFASRIFPGYSL